MMNELSYIMFIDSMIDIRLVYYHPFYNSLLNVCVLGTNHQE